LTLNDSTEYDDALDEHTSADPELYEEATWDELEDPEDVDDAEHAAVDDAASKQSSETLATQSSKRSRDDSDDDGHSTADGPSPDIPGEYMLFIVMCPGLITLQISNACVHAEFALIRFLLLLRT
jgi:hypothetical protein